MIPFSETEEMKEYVVSSIITNIGTYTFNITRTPAPFTFIRIVVRLGNLNLGSASLDMTNLQFPIQERWNKFMDTLKELLKGLSISEEIPPTQIEIFWNKIAALMFTIQNDHIVVEESP